MMSYRDQPTATKAIQLMNEAVNQVQHTDYGSAPHIPPYELYFLIITCMRNVRVFDDSALS